MDIQIKVSFKSQNPKKGFLAFKNFLMILNKIFHFYYHPSIIKIRTDILVYEKGGVIRHIKAPAIVKVELTDL